MDKTPEELLEFYIQKYILPKYDFLKLKGIEKELWGLKTKYSVKFITSKKLDIDTQKKIDTDIEKIFSSIGVDVKSDLYKSEISVWYKTPREKYFRRYS